MGVTIKCAKTKRSLDLTTSGFDRFRRKVAELHSEVYGKHYAKLSTAEVMCLRGVERKRYFDAYDKETVDIINRGEANVKIVDFCLQSDEGGRIRYGACKKILEAIGDYDDGLIYGYAGWDNPPHFADVKALLQECADNKCDFVWC